MRRVHGWTRPQTAHQQPQPGASLPMLTRTRLLPGGRVGPLGKTSVPRNPYGRGAKPGKHVTHRGALWSRKPRRSLGSVGSLGTENGQFEGGAGSSHRVSGASEHSRASAPRPSSPQIQCRPRHSEEEAGSGPRARPSERHGAEDLHS